MSFYFPSTQLYGVSVSIDAPFAIQVHRRRYSEDLVNLFDHLTGAWELQRYTAPSETNAADILYPLGEEAKGILMYSSCGYVSCSLLRPGQLPIQVNGYDAQAKLAESMRRYLGYAGPFLLEETDFDVKIQHHMALVNFPNWMNNVQKWVVHFEGDTLILTLDGTTDIEGVRRRPVWVWKKMPLNNGEATPAVPPIP